MNYELGVGVKNGPNLPGYDYVPWRLTQSNHGGIVEYHGQEYLFYHTSALSSWRQDRFQGPGTWTQRSVCIIIPIKVSGLPERMARSRSSKHITTFSLSMEWKSMRLSII